MAQDIAAERDITPQEALLGLVRTAAGRAAWTDAVVVAKLRRHVEAGGDPMDPPDGLVPWLRQSRDERIAAMRTAKSAVDAGVMVALERRLDLEGEVIADSLGAALDALELTHEQRVFALTVAQARMLGEESPAAPEPVPSAPVEEPEEPDLMDDFRRFAEEEGFDPDELGDDQEDDDDGE